MWPTVDGLRKLRGAEADLFRGAIGMMVDHLVAEYRDDEPPWTYGIDAFDMWDAEQKLWLVHRIAKCLLTRAAPPPPAAIWEATVDAIVCEIVDLVEIEIADPAASQRSRSWRQSVVDAFVVQNGRAPVINVHDPTLTMWRTTVASIADVILPAASYQKAEAFRDGDPRRLETFLIERGLPSDFLDRMPPVQSVADTQLTIDAVQAIVWKETR
jgi:hypothetical protein